MPAVRFGTPGSAVSCSSSGDVAGLEIGGEAYDEQADAETQAKLLAILGPDKVHLAPLVDQLLFMEESL